jgi:hypothetical protein
MPLAAIPPLPLDAPPRHASQFTTAAPPRELVGFTPWSPHRRAAAFEVQDVLLQRFEASLQPADALLLRHMRRLSPAARDSAVADLGPVETLRRGFRFSDEAVAGLSPGTAALMLQTWRTQSRSRFRTIHILVTLWHRLDPLTLELLVDVMHRGANLLFSGVRDRPQRGPNTSRTQTPDGAFLQLVDDEASQGWLAPFSPRLPFPELFVAPLDILPKSDGSGRLTDNNSYGDDGKSVNEATDPTKDVFCSFDDFARAFLRIGRSAIFLKLDFKAAYRQVWLRWRDYHLCGLYVEGRGYTWRLTLGYGHKAACNRWLLVANCFRALVEAHADSDPGSFAQALNDFFLWVDDLIRACNSWAEAMWAREICLRVAELYGFGLSPPKLSVSAVSEFTGITVDAPSLLFSVAPAKRAKALALLIQLQSAAPWSKRDMQRLAGHYNRFAKILPALRPVSRRSVAHLNARGGRHPVQPSDAARLDAKLLHEVLLFWRGTVATHMLAAPLGLSPEPPVVFELDGSPAYGWGVLSPTLRAFSLAPFSPAQLAAAYKTDSYSSVLLELLVVPHVLATFEDDVRGRHVLLLGDNEGVFLGFDRRTSSPPTSCPHIAAVWRVVTALQIHTQCHITARPMPRAHNKAADRLSKGQIEDFHRVVKGRDLVMAPAPTPPRPDRLIRWAALSPLFA